MLSPKSWAPYVAQAPRLSLAVRKCGSLCKDPCSPLQQGKPPLACCGPCPFGLFAAAWQPSNKARKARSSARSTRGKLRALRAQCCRQQRCGLSRPLGLGGGHKKNPPARRDANNDAALREASGQGHADLVALLLEHGADVHADNEYALRVASDNAHADVVALLLEHGAKAEAEHKNSA